jgi:transcriptional regulator with XRE-family HTH domain
VTEADNGPSEQEIARLMGRRLRLRRKLLGFTQVTLAARLGVSFQQVQRYEKGLNQLTLTKLWRLSRLLNVPIGFWFDDLKGKKLRRQTASNPLAPLPELQRFMRLAPDVLAAMLALVKALLEEAKADAEKPPDETTDGP